MQYRELSRWLGILVLALLFGGAPGLGAGDQEVTGVKGGGDKGKEKPPPVLREKALEVVVVKKVAPGTKEFHFCCKEKTTKVIIKGKPAECDQLKKGFLVRVVAKGPCKRKKDDTKVYPTHRYEGVITVPPGAGENFSIKGRRVEIKPEK
jgi:hypothetical protein